jgi:hypothetical protein
MNEIILDLYNIIDVYIRMMIINNNIDLNDKSVDLARRCIEKGLRRDF